MMSMSLTILQSLSSAVHQGVNQLAIKPLNASRKIVMALSAISCLLLSSYCLSTQAKDNISIRDSQQLHQFEKIPQRVVALSWELAEQMIELDAPLIAIADVKGYQEWVVKPALPSNIEDLGGRAEPNLEKIAQLKPDLILINALQEPLLKRLQQIAPVMIFNAFSSDHDNPQVAIDIFKKLAKLFGKQQYAAQKLTDMADTFQALKAQLVNAYAGKLPKVSTVRFANTSSVYIYGDNAMSQYALEQLGIAPAMAIEKTQWGLVQKRVLQLSRIQQGTVLYFKPFEQWSQLQQSRLWQAMPAVRNQRVAAIESTWTYGGAMSLKYLAQAMTESLLGLQKAQSIKPLINSAQPFEQATEQAPSQ